MSMESDEDEIERAWQVESSCWEMGGTICGYDYGSQEQKGDSIFAAGVVED
jgi:hypothetical protein